MWHAVFLALATVLAINAVLFAIAFKRQSDKLTDISYALSFLAIDALAAALAGARRGYGLILFLLVALWAVRIGGFLLLRVLRVGKDRRFDGIRQSLTRFGKFWLGQALTAWVLMLPVVFAQQRGGRFTPLAFVGLAVWAVGLTVESLADYQKFKFKRQPSGGTEWIQTGVWKYARHPNYFGEIAVWTGVYIYCFGALTGIERLISLGSPLLITVVLLFVSGVPLLEKSADKRWGTLPEYQAYKRRTRLLVPLPRRFR